MTIVKERLVELRNAKGLSQRDLADMIGVPPGTLAMWEKGKRNPKEESIENLAKALSCDINYLKGISDKPFEVKTEEDIFAGLSPKERKLFEALRALPIDEYEKKMEELIFFLDNQE